MNTLAGTPESVTLIPFRVAGGQNPLILLPVYVQDNGPYEFILDTGPLTVCSHRSCLQRSGSSPRVRNRQWAQQVRLS
jgi:hypothetical protein